MVNPKEPITGVIETEDKVFTFYFKDYLMIFMDTVVNSYPTSTLKSEDKFAKAISHNGYKMLLHIGNKDFPIANTRKLHSSSYIISESNVFDYDLSYYDGILFMGGTLSKLKRPHAFKTEHNAEDGKSYIEHLDDTQTFSFSTDDFTCEVTIGSLTSESFDLESTSITNDKVYFKMLFNKRQTTSSVYKHYGKLCELMSFLTNRQNVGVDEIYLIQKDVMMGDIKETSNIARVYIEDTENFTQKHIFQNLEFDLVIESLPKLLEMLYNPQEKKPSYSLGFYPQNDECSNIITNNIVRNVCSALECELSFVDEIKSDEEKKIKALKKKIRPIIEEHKKSPEMLKDKTYSLIESSMSHWSMAASDQIKALYHMYDEEMTLANQSNIVIGDDEIDEFVKYRNHITHGSYRVLDYTLANTTRLLSCLVYCCILTRVGIPRDNIKNWFCNGRLLR